MTENMVSSGLSRPQRFLWWLLVLVLAVPVAVTTGKQWLPGLGAQFSGSRTASSPGPAVVDLPGKEVPIMPSPHIPRLGVSHATYNSLPPTSGPHLAWTIAPGIYREPVPDELGVHALEHGHVLLQYARSTPQADVELLEAIGRKYPRDVIVAPYPKLARGVAYTAWGRAEVLASADAASADIFVRKLRGRYDHGWVSGWRPGDAHPDGSDDR